MLKYRVAPRYHYPARLLVPPPSWRQKLPAGRWRYGEKGGHGFGLAPKDPVLSTWPERCAAWMKARGLFEKKAEH